MNRTQMLLCLPALLAIALTSSHARADDSDTKKTDSQKILEKLDQLKDENALLRLEITRLRQEVAKVERDAEDQRRLYEQRDLILQNKLSTLDNRLSDLERGRTRTANYPPDQPTLSADEVRALKEGLKRLERMDQRSYFNPTEPVGPPPPALGTVRVTNTSLFACTITINGSAYRVLPGQTVPILNVPAGVFTYEVVSDGMGFLKRNTLPLVANGEKTLTIF
jgi:hypothetical protein